MRASEVALVRAGEGDVIGTKRALHFFNVESGLGE
jgi:hypothetical protein